MAAKCIAFSYGVMALIGESVKAAAYGTIAILSMKINQRKTMAQHQLRKYRANMMATTAAANVANRRNDGINGSS